MAETVSRPAGHASLKDLDFKILQQCMHCGMCLPSCPTFIETGRERHSPRGRIALMRAAAEDRLPVDAAFAEEMSYCLGCLACTSACPAGVDYATLLETARAETERKGLLTGPRRSFWRWFAMRVVFRRPALLSLAGRSLRLVQRLGLDRLARRTGLVRLLPRELATTESLAPRVAPAFTRDLVAEVTRPPAGVPTKGRALVLSGCVQDLVFGDVNRDTVEVLAANGWEVHVPAAQGCCGSLHAHNGDETTARDLAEGLVGRFGGSKFDVVVSNAAGCGSHLKRFGHLLAGTPLAAEARAWDARVRDVHELLAASGVRAPRLAPPGWEGKRVAYHDACHLAHGQGIRLQPRQVLGLIPGLVVVPLAESDLCCGSAGIYTVTQPETSAWLLRRKVEKIAASGADALALANPGCHLQVARGLAADPATSHVRVIQPICLLASAYRAERASGAAGATRVVVESRVC